MQKKSLAGLWVSLGILLSTLSLGVSQAANEALVPDKVIAFPAGYDTMTEGASSYNGLSNVKNSPYFTANDYYNMSSTDTLTLLPHYKTYQQTTEITCGPAAALTVLEHFGNHDWQEKEIAAIMGTKPAVGTNTQEMVRFFKAIGWDVQSSLTTANKDGISFASDVEFKNFIIDNLKHNTPVLVENIDWGGHWRAIIGYDTMGTEVTADDVIILADSYDTADQWQDGYAVNPAQKFYYMWFDAHMLPAGQQLQQWLVAKPK